MSGLDIRLARPDDRLKLIELQRRASLATETGEILQKLLEQPELFDIDDELIAGNQVFVAHRRGHIVGFATIVADEGNDGELESLFVEPTEWRKGVGRALVQRIEREAINRGATRLRVVANEQAAAFYEAVGFSAIGEQVTPLVPLARVMVRAVH